MSGPSASFRRAKDLVGLVAAAGVAAASWRYALARRTGAPKPESPEPTSPQRPGSDDKPARVAEPHIEIDKSPESTAAATGTAVAHVLGRPDSIRQRAQNAATISTAVIAALALASVTQIAGSDTESWRWWTVLAVIASTILWIATVVAFVRAVAFGPARKVERPGYQALLDAYEEYSDTLRRNLRIAAVVSAVALVMTAFAVGSVVFELNYVRERERQLVLTPTGMSAVASLCGWRDGRRNVDERVNVRVSSDELSREVVEMDVLSRPAPLEPECEVPEVRLPRAAVLAAGDLDR